MKKAQIAGRVPGAKFQIKVPPSRTARACDNGLARPRPALAIDVAPMRDAQDDDLFAGNIRFDNKPIIADPKTPQRLEGAGQRLGTFKRIHMVHPRAHFCRDARLEFARQAPKFSFGTRLEAEHPHYTPRSANTSSAVRSRVSARAACIAFLNAGLCAASQFSSQLSQSGVTPRALASAATRISGRSCSN